MPTSWTRLKRNCCSQATISFRAAIGLDRRASALRIPGCYGLCGAHRRPIGIGAIRALAVEPGRDHDSRGLGRAVYAAGCRLIERHRHPTVRRREVRHAVIFGRALSDNAQRAVASDLAGVG